MRQQQAEKAANIVIGLAALGAAYFILRSPSARRTARQVVKTALGAAGPWLVAEAQRAWNASRTSQAPGHTESAPAGARHDRAV